ncbi:AraC family transcriptional regulator [Paenibacillus sp. FSL R7-0273]|uniref:AraC family transcriptional regulator n=1 Tax=Paenibacillus sp. FSL R7-0273 TaxID=1536772 RepID=UPI00063FC763|nr:AraC family transcriptional regulator [Paenibacillus sp. FSL R7-0273]OMF94702.1 AraC family transcriptional regulator [Paenibacillus sp. FSL R7-0273]
MLPFSLVELPRQPDEFPLYPYSVGHHIQYHHVRPAGFPVHQVFLIRSGSGLFRDLTDGTETVLSPGMVFAFPPDRGHEYYPLSHEPWHLAFIGFDGGQSAAVLEGLRLLPSVPVRTERFEECWDMIAGIWHTVDRHNAARLDEHTMQELSITLYRLLLMLRRGDSSLNQTERPETETVRNEALQKAVSLINEHFTEPLLIANLASAVGYSVQHFQRLFLQVYGVTPHKYLQNLRLQRALQMITESPERPVQDLALNVGMETNYFIRVFRKTYGCTPGVMRSRLAGERDSPLG